MLKKVRNATPTRNSFFGGLFSSFGNRDATNGELDSVGMGDGGVGASNHTPISLVNTGRKADVEYAKSRATIVSSSLKKRNLYMKKSMIKSIDPFKACAPQRQRTRKPTAAILPRGRREKSDKNGKGKEIRQRTQSGKQILSGQWQEYNEAGEASTQQNKAPTVSEPRINGKLFAVLEDSHFRYLSTSQSDIFGNASTTATGSGMSRQ